MTYRELTDEEWERIRPHLPAKAKTGRPRADDRKTLNGILFVLLSGCRWSDMPVVYGSHKTAWRRLKEWEQQGVWERLWRECLNASYEAGEVNLTEVALDSSTVAAKKGRSRRLRRTQEDPGDEDSCRRDRRGRSVGDRAERGERA